MEEIKQRGRHFKLIARSPELAVTHKRVDHATLGSRFSACKKTVIGRFLSALAHINIDNHSVFQVPKCCILVSASNLFLPSHGLVLKPEGAVQDMQQLTIESFSDS